MQLNEEDKKYAEFNFKARIIGGFVFCTLFSFIFLITIIVLAIEGRGELAAYFILPLVFCLVFAICLGVYIHKRRDKREQKQTDQSEINNNQNFD